jgi:general transcription factor 3C polypeptide 3 (transcription factor C subunit 4)
MDYALVGEESRERYYTEKGTHSNKGHVEVNNDMDVGLLMLYGHILYAGTSYPYALSMSGGPLTLQC